jgi:hypothetical protein
MKYYEVADVITHICADAWTDFRQKTAHLFNALNGLSNEDIIRHIEYGGVIPESFSHDSSEEKLFAKYCDFLLAKGLTLIGIPSYVIEERADAADVIGTNKIYRIVGDAKAFRLSRTAKNQKDFKVEALNQWKNGADYACLVCPLYQYPTRTSQIYSQAIRYNVTLFSFTHLGFLLNEDKVDELHLEGLWGLSRRLSSDKEAVPYWNAISQQVANIAGVRLEKWDKYLNKSKLLTLEQAQKQLGFWESEKNRIRALSHDRAVNELINALRIDSNIQLIARTVSELETFVSELD